MSDPTPGHDTGSDTGTITCCIASGITTDVATKYDELRVRRILARRGLELRRSRVRDPAAQGWGLYGAFTQEGEPLTGGFRLTLDELEAWAERTRPRRSTKRAVTAVPEEPCVDLHVGNALDVLPLLTAESHQAIITSPPYFWQRDYQHDDQIGMERTPDEWAARIVEVCRAAWRVLRDDGVMWIVAGDGYNQRTKIGPSAARPGINGVENERWADTTQDGRTRLPISEDGLKLGDLFLLPHRLALALQQDGWIVRSDIIWHRTAHLPESGKTRPVSAHEHILMLTKSQRYFYDPGAIAEPMAPSSIDRYRYGFENRNAQKRTAVQGEREPGELRQARSVWHYAATGVGGDHPAMMPVGLAERCIAASTKPGDRVLDMFGGLGTTALAAARLGRQCTLVELNRNYAKAARKRLGKLVRIGKK